MESSKHFISLWAQQRDQNKDKISLYYSTQFCSLEQQERGIRFKRKTLQLHSMYFTPIAHWNSIHIQLCWTLRDLTLLIRGYCKLCQVLMSLHLASNTITPGLCLVSDLCHVEVMQPSDCTSSEQLAKFLLERLQKAHHWVITVETNSDDNG